MRLPQVLRNPICINISGSILGHFYPVQLSKYIRFRYVISEHRLKEGYRWQTSGFEPSPLWMGIEPTILPSYTTCTT